MCQHKTDNSWEEILYENIWEERLYESIFQHSPLFCNGKNKINCKITFSNLTALWEKSKITKTVHWFYKFILNGFFILLPLLLIINCSFSSFSFSCTFPCSSTLFLTSSALNFSFP